MSSINNKIVEKSVIKKVDPHIFIPKSLSLVTIPLEKFEPERILTKNGEVKCKSENRILSKNLHIKA